MNLKVNVCQGCLCFKHIKVVLGVKFSFSVRGTRKLNRNRTETKVSSLTGWLVLLIETGCKKV